MFLNLFINFHFIYIVIIEVSFNPYIHFYPALNSYNALVDWTIILVKGVFQQYKCIILA